MPGPKQTPVSVNGSKLAGKMLEGGRSSGGKAQLAELIEALELFDLVDTVLEDAGAIMIARTSDGGALCWSLYLGGERYKRYTPTREAVQELLEALR